MIYAKRDKDGLICGIYSNQVEDGLEEISADSAEFIEFLTRCDQERFFRFLESDIQLIRVLEDLIDILLNKNIITITDFPQPVINKLLARLDFRKKLNEAGGMGSNDII